MSGAVHADPVNHNGGLVLTASSSTCSSGDPNNALCSACGNDPTAKSSKPGEPDCPCANNACGNAAGTCDKGFCDLINKYIKPTINIVSVIFGLIVAGSIIVGGIAFSASEGDPQKAAAAKTRITNSILALVAYMFFYTFLQFIIPGGVFKR